MNPAQRVIADVELAGVVGHDHRAAHQSVMTDRTPKPGFGKRADLLSVEDIDTLVGQMRHEWHLVPTSTPLDCRFNHQQERGFRHAPTKKASRIAI